MGLIDINILKKYGFIKTDKNLLVYWDDYILEDINPQYGYFLQATISIPKKDWGQLEYNLSTIWLHRIYDYEQWVEAWDNKNYYYDTRKVYEGMIENEEDLKFILNKIRIV